MLSFEKFIKDALQTDRPILNENDDQQKSYLDISMTNPNNIRYYE